jgi:hypothetical protein
MNSHWSGSSRNRREGCRRRSPSLQDDIAKEGETGVELEEGEREDRAGVRGSDSTVSLNINILFWLLPMPQWK